MATLLKSEKSLLPHLTSSVCVCGVRYPGWVSPSTKLSFRPGPKAWLDIRPAGIAAVAAYSFGCGLAASAANLAALAALVPALLEQ